MATKLQIFNDALRHVGGARIFDVDPDVDGSESTAILDDAWDTTVEVAMINGDWKFASKTAEITQSTTTTVIDGFTYAYDHPTDWMRTLAYSNRNDFSDYTMSYYYEYLEVEDQRGSWHTNAETFYVKYISSDFVADAEVPNWPTSFADYVGYLLAYRCCERFTQSKQQVDRLEERMEKALRKAKSNDARNLKARPIRPGAWNRAMAGTGIRGTADGTLVSEEITVPEGET